MAGWAGWLVLTNTPCKPSADPLPLILLAMPFSWISMEIMAMTDLIHQRVIDEDNPLLDGTKKKEEKERRAKRE
jgi:hypothetical protein